MSKEPCFYYRKFDFETSGPYLYFIETDPSEEILFFHFHNCIEIAYCEEGEKHFRVENHEFVIHPGEACIIPPFYMHTSFSPLANQIPHKCHYLFFRPNDILDTVFHHAVPPELQWYHEPTAAHVLSHDDVVPLQLIREMIRELNTPILLLEKSLSSLISALLIHLSRRRTTPSLDIPSHPHLKELLPAISYMRDHYDKKITMEQLAKICHMPVKKFSQQFRRETRQTPIHYLYFFRVQKACELMMKTEMSIMEISVACGFSGASSLYINFSRIMGESPSDWLFSHKSFSKENYYEQY